MTEVRGGQPETFLDLSLQKTTHIERALGHLAKAIELELVDISLDPSSLGDDDREKFTLLGQKLARLSGLSYELLADISSATGTPLEAGQPGKLEVPVEEGEKPAALPTGESHRTRSGSVTRAPEDQPRPRRTSPSRSPARTVRAKVGVTTRPETDQTEQNNLYRRIVNPDELPAMRPVDESEAINAEITTDNSIKIGQTQIPLGKHELYLFNALLMLRDKPRSASELRELGFNPDAKSQNQINSSFSRTMSDLIDKLNGAARKEIIKKLGDKKSTRYAVNPKLVLSDVREKVQQSVNTPTGVKKN